MSPKAKRWVILISIWTIAAAVITVLKVYQYHDCMKVGHAKLYCVLFG